MKPTPIDLELFRQFEGAHIEAVGSAFTVVVPIDSIERRGIQLF